MSQTRNKADKPDYGPQHKDSNPETNDVAVPGYQADNPKSNSLEPEVLETDASSLSCNRVHDRGRTEASEASQESKGPKNKAPKGKAPKKEAATANRDPAANVDAPAPAAPIAAATAVYRLVARTANDALRLALALLHLPLLMFPLWRWAVAAYLAWWSFSSSAPYTYHRGREVLSAKVCPLPFVGARLELCRAASPLETGAVNLTKIASSRQQLVVVMDRVSHNPHLAGKMIRQQFAVRDLQVRVGASDLTRKEDMTAALELLIKYTKEIAR